MSFRRIFPLLAMLALLIAPFGRIAAAEAMPHHGAEAIESHCAGSEAPDGDNKERTAIDCMVACAAMASAAELSLAPSPLPATILCALPNLTRAGIQHEADPPPPRFS